MRFRTHAFLLCFVPFVVLLALSFSMIERFVQSTVREGLRASLRQNHRSIARVRSKSDLQNSRFLKVAGENAALKAGVKLLLFEPGEAARNTVEDQLTELCGHMGFDFLLVSAPDGRALAGVVRNAGRLEPLNVSGIGTFSSGLLVLNGYAFQLASTPLDQADENLGTLSVGEYFDFSEFTTLAVLLHHGSVIQSSLPNVPRNELENALKKCPVKAECDVLLRGATYLSIPMEGNSLGEGYMLRSFQSVDSVVGPEESILRHVFAGVAFLCVIVALFCSLATAGSIGEPIAGVIRRLREAEQTGLLPEFKERSSRIREIRDLIDGFDRAAVSVREARDGLSEAYVAFVGSLASALDARDPYTAGHSRRVSRLCCAIARQMELGPEVLRKIRIGALLHDIGKIGIPDVVLQKPGKLTAAEFALIRQHPEIGRRILESVQGFAPYLPAVELHHENWDGSGYPHGQSGTQTPVEARIVHVADAFDAMTTDRPYRQGMSAERARGILREYAGVQFDPRVVEAFLTLPPHPLDEESALAVTS